MFQSLSQWIATENHSREQPPGATKKLLKAFLKRTLIFQPLPRRIAAGDH